MKIVPLTAPANVEGALQSRQQTPKERAVAAFMNPGATNQAQATPVANPTAVSPEDALAIRAATANPTEQNSNAEGTAAEVTPPADATSDATQTKEVEQSLSPRYAQLARQEKALRQRDAAIKAERAELQKLKDDLLLEKATYASQYVPKDRLTRETLQVLQEQGIDYSALTQQALSSADPELSRRDAEINGLKAVIEELKKDVQGTKDSFKQNQEQSYTQAVAMIRQEAVSLVKNDPTFETIKATNSVSEVVDLIQKTFEEGLDEDHPKGTLMSVEEAAQIVEEHLVEQYAKVAKLEKIQKRNAPKVEPPKQVQEQKPQGSKPTLTNTMTGTAKKEYSSRQRAMFAAQYGRDWESKVSGQQ